jgi:hypothetical protein
MPLEDRTTARQLNCCEGVALRWWPVISETQGGTRGCGARKSNVGFEVLRAVLMKSAVFWDKTPCSLLRVNRRIGGTRRLRLQSRSISVTCQKTEIFTILLY